MENALKLKTVSYPKYRDFTGIALQEKSLKVYHYFVLITNILNHELMNFIKRRSEKKLFRISCFYSLINLSLNRSFYKRNQKCFELYSNEMSAQNSLKCDSKSEEIASYSRFDSN
jgi:hypothetical protein